MINRCVEARRANEGTPKQGLQEHGQLGESVAQPSKWAIQHQWNGALLWHGKPFILITMLVKRFSYESREARMNRGEELALNLRLSRLRSG